ncbi:MAG TPA: ELM1/GtrOC1 family putative glycosyltransferase [Gammaproteobacteria bacterium]|nr:ELM1/GtrOC1 family putative glycosyltransferase [Gammaproteobacteria bacterium]
MNARRGAPLTVWRFHDGKPGHERQTAGLLAALARRRPLEVIELDARDCGLTWWHPLLRRLPAALARRPAPALVVGAGRACEWAIFAARRAHRTRAVYLMKPRLPPRCFDLCLVPQHDGLKAGPHVEPTQGVLNDIVPGTGPRDGPVLVLVGGPSAHHTWDEAALLRQIASLVFGRRERRFAISDSRRTPPSTAAKLAEFAQPGVSVHSHLATPPDWLREALARAPEAWVTADSVSMLFEALSAGCAVGVLEVPAKRADRINAIAPALIAGGLVGTLAAWLADPRLPHLPQPLAEATRCAELVDCRLLGGEP